MKYSFDILNLYKTENFYVLLVSGWCFDQVKAIPDISLRVNGNKVKIDLVRISRSDVCTSYELSAKQYLNCGFRLKQKIDENISTFEILAESTVIFSKKGKELDSFVRNSSIAYDIEEATMSEDTSMYHLRGWACSLQKDNVSFFIYGEKNEIVESVIRTMVRPDLSAFTSDEKIECGFNISFHYEKNHSYYLVFKTNDDELSIPVNELLKKNRFQISKIFEKINFDNISKGLRYLKENGFSNTVSWIKNSNNPEYAYQNWFGRHCVTKEELKGQKNTHFSYEPCISIVVPTYNTPGKLLREMIDSVRNQSYENWQLCIADGSDASHEAKKIIRAYTKKDNRICVSWLDQNYGISGNTNKAIEISKGEYIALFDHDDLLEPDALYEVVKSLQGIKHDIVYTDEDKLNDQTGFYEDPNLKPDWSPDLFLSHNYITHLFVVKSSIVKEIGGFRSEYDGAQDYDLMFRCIEKSNSIHHLAKVLYHWRIHEGSTAGDPESKMYAFEAGRKAIQSHLDRTGIKGKAFMLGKPLWGLYRVEYEMEEEPLVSIIIPNYEHVDILNTCVQSLFTINTYSNFEIIIVENNSKTKDTFDYYEKIQKEHNNVHVVEWKGTEFNYSAINNYGVTFAKGEYILLLNNDTEMIAPDSLRELVSNCMRDEVGIVGAKLLYEDNSIQHAGVVIGFSGYAGHVFTGIMNSYEYGYMMRAAITCDYSAVTAACLMTKKNIWDKVGGLDEQFKVACNDIDYCLKVRDLNKLVVYDAFSIWHHYESKSRGYEDSPEKKARYEAEVAKWQKKWNKYLPNNDPYYNKNFAIEKGPYILD